MNARLRRGLTTLALAGALGCAPFARPAAAVPPPVGATQSVHAGAGLETVEALLEDLSFRNLELHDREAMVKASHTAGKGGTLVVSVGGWTGTIPGSRSAAPPAGGKRSIPDAANLSAYVNLLSRCQPGGVVSGYFSDWRSPSVYRAVAGRHYGYDIAYPPGTSVGVGWAGEVVSIANWYGNEYGITVQSPRGFRVTYGHLSPTTRVGAWVNPGDVVGRVVRDHVDVKMRGADGSFIDFAHGIPGGGASYIAANPRSSLASRGGGVVLNIKIRGAAPSAPRLLPPLAGPTWTHRIAAVRAAIGYLRARHQEAALIAKGVGVEGGALAVVRRQLDEARGRLLENAVPEEVLLAAFVDTPAFEDRALWGGEGPTGEHGVDGLESASGDGDLRTSAREAVSRLRALLGELNAQPPAPRS